MNNKSNDMSNAQNIIDEIDFFIDKSMLKKSKITNEEVNNFIEQKWQEADSEKYNIHEGSIFIGRMINEYNRLNDFDNMMRWIIEHEKHFKSKKNPAYINNYYYGQRCLECGNEEKALEYFKLSYAENKEYIFTRAPFCYEFFNKHVPNSKELANTHNSNEEVLDSGAETINWADFEIPFELKPWQIFFECEDEELYYVLYDEFSEEILEPSKEQENGLAYLQKNQEIILKNFLNELLKRYPELQKKYNYPEEEKQSFMPDLTSIDGFADLISPINFYITSVIKDDYPYIGIGFGCSWDGEHGLGVMTHKDRIVEIDGADLAFDICAAEEDLENYQQ